MDHLMNLHWGRILGVSWTPCNVIRNNLENYQHTLLHHRLSVLPEHIWILIHNNSRLVFFTFPKMWDKYCLNIFVRYKESKEREKKPKCKPQRTLSVKQHPSILLQWKIKFADSTLLISLRFLYVGFSFSHNYLSCHAGYYLDQIRPWLFSAVEMSVTTFNKVILAKDHITSHNIMFPAIPNLWLLVISTDDRKRGKL